MTTTPNFTTFYVYALARPIKKEWQIFYIGKGSKRRVFGHEKEAKSGHKCHKCNVIRKVWREGFDIQRYILLTTEDEQEAFEYEKEMIALHGRDNLVNKTDGGDGSSGVRVSEKTRELQRQHGRALWHRPGMRELMIERLKERLATPEMLEKKRAIGIEWSNRPGVREMLSERGKKIWEDPELRDRMIRNSKAVLQTEEHRQKRSRVARANWSDPVMREQMMAKAHAVQRTPEYRARISELQKAYRATPEGQVAIKRANSIAAIKNAKLTKTQGEEIRQLYATGQYRQSDLAVRFGVGNSAVGRIVRNEQIYWRDDDTTDQDR